MDILTGSSGFLGSYLAKEIKGESLCLPHQFIYTSKIESFNNFYFLSTYGNMSWQDETEKIIKANILDLIHVLEQIKWDEIHSFIYVSSSSVNLKVQNTYSRTKKAAEEILLSYMEKYDAPITIVRPYSMIGVGDQREHLIPTLIRSAITGLKMPFASEAYHDYINVEDVVDAILTLSEQQAKGIFELGTGIQRSNFEVKELVERITGCTVFIQEVEKMRSYDCAEWVCKDFRVRKYGWEPKRSFEDTIASMVKAYDN